MYECPKCHGMLANQATLNLHRVLTCPGRAIVSNDPTLRIEKLQDAINMAILGLQTGIPAMEVHDTLVEAILNDAKAEREI
jgi:hypothetical protein